ncbi:FecCD family ABC transporter permease [Streptococcus macacae]|uniref:Iron chelate uptake ABC transporter, FeCT family, permease protein n=1 Tax=Streptococcus macacae NCTC 11558 TaxID=764298 RepID=G5JYB9_9STRE|nr:iron ABC transporter permease [Streptococcus macacae]EHJ52108.1 iron chelate uptake ABC transporter, FeCT family, permease protein [Streptococcus macacae NCTC 11558]SUN78033.1 iron compound ABC transporter permease [Streptococcus macacae NCTC 11558]
MINSVKIKRVFLCLIFLLFIFSPISLSIGQVRFSVFDILDIFLGRSSDAMVMIITNIRLPRILVCLFAGASLALSGMLLQTLTHNPLADSGILGINTGAGIVIALTISYLNIENRLIISFLPVMAMLGGCFTILLVYFIARQKNNNISPTRLIITGVGVSTMLSGTMVSIVGSINRYKVDYIVHWLSGQISGDNWTTLLILAPLLVFLWLWTYSRSQTLNIMNLNDHTALALGLRLQKERLVTLILATSLAAFSVILVGNIAFIGLVAGHIARRLLGSNHFISLPAAMLIGMLILLLADTVGRVFLIGTGIPTGLIVSILGAPYFLYLMTKADK